MTTESEKNRVLIITQYSLPDDKRNMNAYQRNYYGSQHAEVHLLMRRSHTASRDLQQRLTVHRAPVNNRVLFFFYAIGLGVWLRFRGVDIILTEPSKFAWVGFALKYIAGYFWVMDVWDPVWKVHCGAENRIKLIDRISFRAMRKADFFVLSCLPEAARHIRPAPERSAQFFNAIDLSDVIAKTPPDRADDAGELQLALARFKLGEKEGFSTVVKAAEELKAQGVRVKIHLVGHLDGYAAEVLAESPASDLFEVHGFISKSRCEFFRTVHVGLVPYLAIEDMCHIFPIKVLEHLSQGNAVIASHLPGLATMVRHEFNGLLFEAGNSHALAESILRLNDDVEFWSRLSMNAIESVKKYDPAAKNRKIFEEIRRRRAEALHVSCAVSRNARQERMREATARGRASSVSGEIA